MPRRSRAKHGPLRPYLSPHILQDGYRGIGMYSRALTVRRTERHASPRPKTAIEELVDTIMERSMHIDQNSSFEPEVMPSSYQEVELQVENSLYKAAILLLSFVIRFQEQRLLSKANIKSTSTPSNLTSNPHSHSTSISSNKYPGQ